MASRNGFSQCYGTEVWCQVASVFQSFAYVQRRETNEAHYLTGAGCGTGLGRISFPSNETRSQYKTRCPPPVLWISGKLLFRCSCVLLRCSFAPVTSLCVDTQVGQWVPPPLFSFHWKIRKDPACCLGLWEWGKAISQHDDAWSSWIPSDSVLRDLPVLVHLISTTACGR